VDERRHIEHIQARFRAGDAFVDDQWWTDALSLPAVGLRASVDCGLAGVHFPWPTDRAADAGWRVLAGALSDLAACGATPVGILLSAVLPRSVSQERLTAFWDGMAACAAMCNAPLLGGNVSVGALGVHVTVFGHDQHPRAGRAPLAPGDLLWLTGTHGDASLGLAAVQQELDLPQQADRFLRDRYWRPQPRFSWGDALWSLPSVVGVIDVSDGWLRDLDNLVRTGAVGLALDPQSVPRSWAWRLAATQAPRSLAVGYWGGDDYELAFATRGVAEADCREQLASRGVDAACVGHVAATALHWLRTPAVDPPPRFGYDPFSQTQDAT